MLPFSNNTRKVQRGPAPPKTPPLPHSSSAWRSLNRHFSHSSTHSTFFLESPIAAMLPVAAARTPPALFHLLFSTSVLILLAYFAYILRLPEPNSKFLHLAGAGKSVTGDSATFPHFAGWKFNFSSEFDLKICIVSTTSAGLVEILPWILYHKVVGVTDFFLFVEGKAASIEAHRVLNSIQGVKLINRTHELEMQQAKSRIWNESWLDDFKYKPCNYELFTKQTLNMETGIAMAREAGIDWIVHIDTDELLYPAGSREYSVQKLLSDVPKLVDLVVFPNYESAVEKDDIKLPFHEVTMFKKNHDHLLKEKHDHLIEEAYYVDEEYEENPSYFLTYGNGKSAARIQDNLRPNGAHRWYNYKKEPKEMMFEEAAVLHYSYAKFSDLTSRRQRCNCKLTREAVEKCFMLDFDREAFAIASSGTEEEMLQWYQDIVVWSNEERKLKLLKEGVLTRIYTPMVIMQMLRASGVYSEAFQLSRC